MTIELWFKTTFTGSENPLGGMFSAWGAASGGDDAFNLRVDASGSLSIYYILPDDTGGGASATTAPLNDGRWHHIAVLFFGTTWQVYVDGVARTTNAQATFRQFTDRPFEIGFYWGGGGYFNGQLDEVAIYPVALTAAQIAQHYALRYGAGTYPERVIADGASAYWRL